MHVALFNNFLNVLRIIIFHFVSVMVHHQHRGQAMMQQLSLDDHQSQRFPDNTCGGSVPPPMRMDSRHVGSKWIESFFSLRRAFCFIQGRRCYRSGILQTECAVCFMFTRYKAYPMQPNGVSRSGGVGSYEPCFMPGYFSASTPSVLIYWTLVSYNLCYATSNKKEWR
jgi:hypothetical protein